MAAVNIFNAHLNKPFILAPIEDRVKSLKSKCDSAKKGLRLPFSKEEIDKNIEHLSLMLTAMKGVTFLYNAFVLCLWGWYSFALLKKEFGIDDAERFLRLISITSFVVVLIGVIIRIILPFVSDIEKIRQKDTENLTATNAAVIKETTQSENFQS